MSPKLESMKALWLRCFPEDNEAYVNLFYSYYGHSRYHYTIEEAGKVISMLHHIDTYKYPLFGKELRCSYIYAACTSPEQRGKGLMGQLMEQTLRTLHEKHIPLCVTIPATKELFDFYGRFGFVPAFKRWYERWDKSPFHVFVDDMMLLYDLPDELVVDWLTTTINGRLQGNMRHTPRDIRFVLESTRLSGGYTVGVANNRQELVAFAIVDKTDLALRVRDYTATTPFAICELFELLRRTFPLPLCIEQMVPGEEEEYFGAMRIVDLPLLMKTFATHPHMPDEICYIKDPLIPANNGLYQFIDRHFSFQPCDPPELSEDGIPVYDIAEYTQMLFAKQQSFMSLMMD